MNIRTIILTVGLTCGVACGGGSSRASSEFSPSPSVPANVSQAECVDRMVAMFNSLDISGITVNADGNLDDTQKAELKSRVGALQSRHPEFESGGPCVTAFDVLSDEEKSAVLARIDPKIALLLGASARTQFSVVASSIN